MKEKFFLFEKEKLINKIILVILYLIKYLIMNVLNYTEFRNKLKPTLDSVVDDGETVIINRGGENNAVLISLKEYNSIKETMYLLATEKNRNRLSKAIARDKKGEYEKHKLIEE